MTGLSEYSEALVELRDYAQDVLDSPHRTATNAVQRFLARLDTPPLPSLFAGLLPTPDFEAWHTGVMATQGAMLGSGELTWPAHAPERVALQLELLRRIGDGRVNLWEFTLSFFPTGTDYDINYRSFARLTFQPFYRDLLRLLKPRLEELDTPEPAVPAPSLLGSVYVSLERIEALRAKETPRFDLAKIIRICEELNNSHSTGSLLAIAALVRTLLDHVPPIFGQATFAQVANNYAGSRSFRASMQHLENSARNIADGHLHTQVRAREVLPTAVQVNFTNDLDVLLGEVLRIL